MIVRPLLCFFMALVVSDHAEGARRAAHEREPQFETPYRLRKPGRYYEEYQPYREGRARNRRHDHFRPGFRCTEFDGACLC
jgi:hypothetical protein